MLSIFLVYVILFLTYAINISFACSFLTTHAINISCVGSFIPHTCYQYFLWIVFLSLQTVSTADGCTSSMQFILSTSTLSVKTKQLIHYLRITIRGGKSFIFLFCKKSQSNHFCLSQWTQQPLIYLLLPPPPTPIPTTKT